MLKGNKQFTVETERELHRRRGDSSALILMKCTDEATPHERHYLIVISSIVKFTLMTKKGKGNLLVGKKGL